MSRFETIDVTRFRGKGVKKLSAPTIRIKRDLEAEKKNMDLLYACFNDYEQFRPRRMEHLRFMRYLNGDQWSDLVADPDNKGKMITERELYRRTGVTPVAHNILQQYIRNVCGQMLSNKYKTPWRRKWQPAPVFLPGKFRGQRSLAGCSPLGHKESDMT